MDALSSLGLVAAALVAGLFIWWPIRARRAQHAEQAFEAINPRDGDGIIVGAEPRFLKGTRQGAVLVLHGFGDSPQSMRFTADALHAAGWTVRVPVLPGHARTLEAFARSGAGDWERAAREELATLRREYPEVAVCGLSMGGALALLLAAEDPGVKATVALSPYLQCSRPMTLWLFLVGPIAALGSRYIRNGGKRSIHDPVASAARVAYRVSTLKLLLELKRVAKHAYDALPLVRSPVLVMQSREDNRIPQRFTADAFERIGSADKRIEWLNNTGHVITVDYGHTKVERMVVSWLNGRLA